MSVPFAGFRHGTALSHSEMPRRNARCVAPDMPYHVTARGTSRQPVSFTASDRHTYMRLLGLSLDESQAPVLTCRLMTNHIHLITAPEAAGSLTILLRRPHGRYTQYLNARRQQSDHPWQRRFFSCPQSAARLATATASGQRTGKPAKGTEQSATLGKLAK